MKLLIFLIILFLFVVGLCLFLLYKSKQEYDALIECIVWEDFVPDE